MFFYLLLAFIGVPLIEIALFIEIGSMIGTPATIATVILTAIVGAWLLRQQGMATAHQAQATLARGDMPVDQAFDGLFLVFAGGLLLTPGFLTDAIGFSLFVPPIRQWLRRRLVAAARRRGAFEVHSINRTYGDDGPYGDEGALWPDPAGPTPTDTPRPPPIDAEAVNGAEDDGAKGDGPKPGHRSDSPWRDG